MEEIKQKLAILELKIDAIGNMLYELVGEPNQVNIDLRNVKDEKEASEIIEKEINKLKDNKSKKRIQAKEKIV